MCKTIGILLIIFAAAGLGMQMSLELKKRIVVLERLLHLVILLKGELRYTGASLHDAFCDISRRLPGEYAVFTQKAAACMQEKKGETFGEIFKKCAKEELPLSVLKADEREAFYFLGTQLGHTDLATQMKHLELCEEKLHHCMEMLQRELPAKKKVYGTMSMFGGLLLVIILW